MKIGHIELFVQDVQKAKKFYISKLRFRETASQHGGTVVWIERDGMEFLLRTGNPSDAPTYQASDLGIVLYTDNLEAERAELEQRGIKFLGIDGSEKCLTFKDLDGHWFQLVSPNDH